MSVALYVRNSEDWNLIPSLDVRLFGAWNKFQIKFSPNEMLVKEW